MTRRENLTFEYNSWKLVYELTKSISEKQEKAMESLFDDFFGVSSLSSVEHALVLEMDARIAFHYNLDFDCDLFQYLVYEASTMNDGGKIVTESGKEYKIRNFEDLLDYLEDNY
jgi:acyl carrier protein